jgi:CheY-like chemotaxis protein
MKTLPQGIDAAKHAGLQLAGLDGSRRPLRVFLVENHTDSRLTLEMLLEQMGCAVQSVETMQDALSEIPGADCDVLLSDIGLPDGDGWQLLGQLHLPRPMYAIAMSGYGMSADRDHSRAVGYRHHLVKPMEPERLEDILHDAAREIDQTRGANGSAAPNGA